ncbi:Calcium-dependent protein kinase 23 [Durusdinium trenchii]|uniref:Calcium-dependent protein kinase 23 n=1 Tax=Durusdinium trenchii TaxID=1381693 RepID=A0ABP0L3K1_9DINO
MPLALSRWHWDFELAYGGAADLPFALVMTCGPFCWERSPKKRCVAVWVVCWRFLKLPSANEMKGGGGVLCVLKYWEAALELLLERSLDSIGHLPKLCKEKPAAPAEPEKPAKPASTPAPKAAAKPASTPAPKAAAKPASSSPASSESAAAKKHLQDALHEVEPEKAPEWAKLNETFALLDSDGNGHISKDELISVVKDHGVDEKEVLKALEEVDADQDGEINYAEFVKLMKS